MSLAKEDDRRKSTAGCLDPSCLWPSCWVLALDTACRCTFVLPLTPPNLLSGAFNFAKDQAFAFSYRLGESRAAPCRDDGELLFEVVVEVPAMTSPCRFLPPYALV